MASPAIVFVNTYRHAYDTSSTLTYTAAQSHVQSRSRTTSRISTGYQQVFRGTNGCQKFQVGSESLSGLLMGIFRKPLPQIGRKGPLSRSPSWAAAWTHLLPLYNHLRPPGQAYSTHRYHTHRHGAD